MKMFNKRAKRIHKSRGRLHDQYLYEDYLSAYNYEITKLSEGFCYFNPLQGGFLPKPRVFTFDEDVDDHTSLQDFLDFIGSDK
jgi:hypothetical protein